MEQMTNRIQSSNMTNYGISLATYLYNRLLTRLLLGHLQRMSAQSSSSGSAAVDDEIVREIDVFLTDAQGLYCLQYPLRPANAPPLNLAEGFFKPKHKVLEVHAEHRAKHDVFLKLSSTLVPKRAGLGVGVLNAEGLHVSPVEEVLQLRPIFRNIPMQRNDNPIGHDNDSDEEASNRSGAPQPQQVLLKKKESDRAVSARAQSYSHLAAQEENEPFVKLMPYGVEESEHKFEQLYYDPLAEEKAAAAAAVEKVKSEAAEVWE